MELLQLLHDVTISKPEINIQRKLPWVFCSFMFNTSVFSESCQYSRKGYTILSEEKEEEEEVEKKYITSS